MKKNIYNIQLVADDININRESQFIKIIYTYYLSQEKEIKNYDDEMTNIHIGIQFKDGIEVLNQDKGKIRGIFVKYDTNKYLKLNAEQRKEQMNLLFKNAFCALFNKLDLNEEIITNIYNSIIENKYKFYFPYKKKVVKNEICKAAIILKPDIDRFTYYVRFTDLNTKNETNVEFFISWAGSPLIGKFEKILWNDLCNSVIIFDKYEELSFIVSKNKIVSINIVEKIHNSEHILSNLNINRFGVSNNEIIQFMKSDKFYL